MDNPGSPVCMHTVVWVGLPYEFKTTETWGNQDQTTWATISHHQKQKTCDFNVLSICKFKIKQQHDIKWKENLFWLRNRAMQFHSRPTNWPLLTTESSVAQWSEHPTGSQRVVGFFAKMKFPWKPYNKSFIDQACSVKMAWYWLHSFLRVYAPRLVP